MPFIEIRNVLSLADGKMTILEIADELNESFNEIYSIVNKLIKHKLIKIKYAQ